MITTKMLSAITRGGGGSSSMPATIASDAYEIPVSEWNLNPTAVRERAKSIAGCKEVPNPNCKNDGKVISFLVDTQASAVNASVSTNSPSSNNSSVNGVERLARVNIFADTGTVGTCRIMNGEVRETFRRNVSSLDTVERLLRYPPALTKIDDRMILQVESAASMGGGGGNNEAGRGASISSMSTTATAASTQPSSASSAQSFHPSLKEQVELAEVGLCILYGEKEKLESHLTHLERMNGERDHEQDSGRKKSNSFRNSSNSNMRNNGSSQLDNKSTNSKSTNNKPKIKNFNIKKPLSMTTTITATETISTSSRGRESMQQEDGGGFGKPMAKGKPIQITNAEDVDIRSNHAEHYDQLEQKKRDNQKQDTEDEEESITSMDFLFSLPAPAMKHVDQCLKDIARMGKLVHGVATNGRGTIFLYGNGGVAYTPNIPKTLYHRLKQLRNSNIASRPSYVSLGSRDRFFVAYNDGTYDWKGPKALDKILKRLTRRGQDSKGNSQNNDTNFPETPRSVSFGNSYETFFIVFRDGSWKFHGRSIPQELADKLADRRDRPDLTCVNLGPRGEWFLRAKNGRMWWGGISESLDSSIQEILNDGGTLHFIDFGEDGSYFLSHDTS